MRMKKLLEIFRRIEAKSASSLKQQSMSRHVAPLGHIILIRANHSFLFLLNTASPRFLCCPAAFCSTCWSVGRQSALHKENSGFASPTPGRHISTFRGYRILFSIRNPYINRFTNHFAIHS
jgi:hypothetical protein